MQVPGWFINRMVFTWSSWSSTGGYITTGRISQINDDVVYFVRSTFEWPSSFTPSFSIRLLDASVKEQLASIGMRVCLPWSIDNIATVMLSHWSNFVSHFLG